MEAVLHNFTVSEIIASALVDNTSQPPGFKYMDTSGFNSLHIPSQYQPIIPLMETGLVGRKALR